MNAMTSPCSTFAPRLDHPFLQHSPLFRAQRDILNGLDRAGELERFLERAVPRTCTCTGRILSSGDPPVCSGLPPPSEPHEENRKAEAVTCAAIRMRRFGVFSGSWSLRRWLRRRPGPGRGCRRGPPPRQGSHTRPESGSPLRAQGRGERRSSRAASRIRSCSGCSRFCTPSRPARPCGLRTGPAVRPCEAGEGWLPSPSGAASSTPASCSWDFRYSRFACSTLARRLQAVEDVER